MGEKQLKKTTSRLVRYHLALVTINVLVNDERIKAKDKDIEQIDAGDSVKWDRELKSRRVH